MTTYLLDANVLIALTVKEHEHHDRASEWFAAAGSFALCPIVEGALIRFMVRVGESAATAKAVVQRVHDHPASSLWPDAVSYREIDLSGVRGHTQVTDAYLVGLVRSRSGGRLATLDQALAASSDVVTLIP